jgi:hypothetical protein
MKTTQSKVKIKYFKFLTYLYEKKYFSISREIKINQIDTYIKNSLLNYNLISGEGKNYKWVGCEPTIKEAEKVLNHCKQIRYNLISNNEKNNMHVSKSITDEQAIEHLKSKGIYRILKQVTDYQEL